MLFAAVTIACNSGPCDGYRSTAILLVAPALQFWYCVPRLRNRVPTFFLLRSWYDTAFWLTSALANVFSSQVKPDVISFTSVIHACAGPHGNWEKAYAVSVRVAIVCMNPRASRKSICATSTGSLGITVRTQPPSLTEEKVCLCSVLP